MSLYLTHATFIDWQTARMTCGTLEVEEGPQGTVRFVKEPPKGARTLDCSDRLVTRSFVVAHHHIYSALARGMPAPRTAPTNFEEILRYIWWNLDKKLDLEMIRSSAEVTAIEALRSGTTFIIDHHASPFAVEGSLHVIAEVLEKAGLGHLLCYELSDRDGEESRLNGLAETESYLKRRHGLVGLHASFTVSEGLLSEALELAARYRTGLHLHVAEAESDQERCLADHQVRVIERLSRAGALASPSTLLAHAIHINDLERALVAASPVWVVQNAESNQNNKVGNFDSRGLGPRLLIGTDGMHSDALASARAAFLASSPGVDLGEIYRRLRGAHAYLEAARVPGDTENNLLILDYRSPTPVTEQNWLGHLFYGLKSAQVESVISQGRLVLHRREVTLLDEAEVLARSREQAKRLWSLL